MKSSTQSAFARRIIAIVGFVAFANVFFFNYIGSTGLALILLGIYLFTTVVFLDKNKTKSHKSMFTKISVLFLLLETALVTKSNGAISVFLIFSLLTLFGFTIYLLNKDKPYIESIIELAFVPFRLLGSYILSAMSVLQFPLSKEMQRKYLNLKLGKPSERIARSLLGFVIGLPIVFILISLLSSADPIFGHYSKGLVGFVGNFFEFLFSEKLGLRLFWSGLIFVILAPLLFFRVKNEDGPELANFKLAFSYEMTIIQFLVSALFVIFIVIEAPYVFVNVEKEVDLSNFGVATYSEYVNKGFGELTTVSVIVFALISFGLFILRKTKKDEGKTLLIAQMTLASSFAIFVLSIFRRIYLYQLYHGWTLDRIYGGVFIFWLFIMLGTVVARHFRDKKWVMVDLAITYCLIVVIGFFNAESFVVNTRPPTVNDKVDYLYLSRMSADGYEGWIKAYKNAKEVTREGNINKDNSYRDFIYAGLSLSEITEEYVSLVNKYGTDADRVKMYSLILTLLEKNYVKEKELIEKNYADNPEIDINYRFIENQRKLEKVRDLNDKNASYNLSSEEFVKYVVIDKYFLLASENYANEIRTFYFVDEIGKGYTRTSKIDANKNNIFDTNFSAKRAHKNLIKEIPIEEFIGLQETYLDTYETLPPVLPDQFQMDTNPFSPFLTSI